MEIENSASSVAVEELAEAKVQEQVGSQEAASVSPEAQEAAPAGSARGEKQQEQLDDEDCDLDDDQAEEILTRQDAFCLFTNEKDLKSHESIAIKAQHSNGISLRVKIVNDKMLDKILIAIMQAKDQGIIKLRFEDCRLLTKAVTALKYFCTKNTIIESLGLIRVSFSDGGSQDFKHLVEAVSFNTKISHF